MGYCGGFKQNGSQTGSHEQRTFHKLISNKITSHTFQHQESHVFFFGITSSNHLKWVDRESEHDVIQFYRMQLFTFLEHSYISAIFAFLPLYHIENCVEKVVISLNYVSRQWKYCASLKLRDLKESNCMFSCQTYCYDIDIGICSLSQSIKQTVYKSSIHLTRFTAFIF